jgi:hypothetical protein
VELEDESDAELKDIGLEPPKRDFDTVYLGHPEHHVFELSRPVARR